MDAVLESVIAIPMPGHISNLKTDTYITPPKQDR